MISDKYEKYTLAYTMSCVYTRCVQNHTPHRIIYSHNTCTDLCCLCSCSLLTANPLLLLCTQERTILGALCSFHSVIGCLLFLLLLELVVVVEVCVVGLVDDVIVYNNCCTHIKKCRAESVSSCKHHYQQSTNTNTNTKHKTQNTSTPDTPPPSG